MVENEKLPYFDYWIDISLDSWKIKESSSLNTKHPPEYLQPSIIIIIAKFKS